MQCEKIIRHAGPPRSPSQQTFRQKRLRQIQARRKSALIRKPRCTKHHTSKRSAHSCRSLLMSNRQNGRSSDTIPPAPPQTSRKIHRLRSTISVSEESFLLSQLHSFSTHDWVSQHLVPVHAEHVSNGRQRSKQNETYLGLFLSLPFFFPCGQSGSMPFAIRNWAMSTIRLAFHSS